MSPTPYYAAPDLTLHLGDCREDLADLADNSVDAICCDPPYEISFMSRAWDGSGIAFDLGVWRECLRVLKPGAHLLAFGGTRTWHRVAVAIEDAGWEIRDTIMWIYGSGFPKSRDVSKAIDKARDDRDDIVKVTAWLAEWAAAKGITRADVDTHMGTSDMGGWWLTTLRHRCQVPTWEQWQQLRGLIQFDSEMDAEVWRLNGRKGAPGEAWSDRPVVGERTTGIGTGRGSVAYIGDSPDRTLTSAATEMSKRWEGWGTALKPGWEPIILARKPLEGTVAANVVEYGTGALNIDACRVGWDARSLAKDTARRQQPRHDMAGGRFIGGESGAYRGDAAPPAGRWPTNLVFTHSESCVEGGRCEPDCPVRELDRQSGWTPSNSRAEKGNGMGYHGAAGRPGGWSGDEGGGASRFFPTFRYEAKAPASERPKLPDGTAWPTVKPLALMRWLVRLVTPPGGTVLDPFAGSGTTGEAAIVEGFQCVLIERDPVAAELIKARLSKAIQPSLFGEVTT